MAKKLVLAFLIALTATFGIMAQDAAKPAADAPAPTATPAPTPAAAKPAKVSYALTQAVAADTYNGLMQGSQIYNDYGNALYSRTNFKAQIDFDLGGGVLLSPWVQERLEIKDDPTTSAGATKGNFRNRFYAGLNFYVPIDKAFNIGFNVEYRNASYIKTDTASSTKVNVPQNRLTEYLVFSGKVGGLYYNLSTDLPYYFSDNSKGSTDSSMLELEGNYVLGYGFTLDDKTTLKLEGWEYIDSYNLLANANVSTYPANLSDTALTSPAFASELRARLILSAAGGDIAPYVGFLKSTQIIYLAGPAITSTVSDIVGVTFGADLKIGSNASFTINADIGVDAASPMTVQPVATEISAGITIKG